MEESLEIDEFLKKLKHAETIAEFREVLYQQAHLFLEIVEKTRDSNNNNIIFRAKQLVRENLSDKLTVRSVAKKFI